MARYIDADKLGKECRETVSKYNVVIDGSEYPVFLVDHILHKIRNYPTADVVEVVRCKECKHGHWYQETCHGKRVHYCDLTDLQIEKEHFCSYGERRDT